MLLSFFIFVASLNQYFIQVCLGIWIPSPSTRSILPFVSHFFAFLFKHLIVFLFDFITIFFVDISQESCILTHILFFSIIIIKSYTPPPLSLFLYLYHSPKKPL